MRAALVREIGADATVTLDGEDLAWLEANLRPPSGDRYADMGTVNR